MFQYYRKAVVCYAFLEGFPPMMAPEDRLSHCRWFSRGWALQELLAPERVEFFNQQWGPLGTKRDHGRVISSITNIPEPILIYGLEESTCTTAVSARMSWASNRRTKCKEDMAYCLLGIFDINMPLIYGEGVKAFRRLQEEIIRRNNDLSIFAWNSISDGQSNDLVDVFASSTAAFKDVQDIRSPRDSAVEFSLTNRDLLLTGEFEIYFWDARKGGKVLPTHYILTVGRSTLANANLGIFLRKCDSGSYCRLAGFPLVCFYLDPCVYNTREVVHAVYVLTDASRQDPAVRSRPFRTKAICTPKQEQLEIQTVVTLSLWDHRDLPFLNLKPWSEDRNSKVLAAEFLLTVNGYQDSIVVICQ
jgi:hypothetical protein